MKSPLLILHVEDDPNDAALIRSTLEAGGIACVITCVSSRDDFVAALERGGIDMILSDFTLPAFDGLSALKIAHTRRPDLPVIMVSGTLGEERAIDSLKNGATDYVLKERLARLVPAVRRAMLGVEEYDKRKRAEEALRLVGIYNRSLIEASLDPFVTIGANGKITDVNAATEAATGCARAELIGTDFSEYFTEPEKARAGYQRVFHEGFVRDYPLELRHRDGHIMVVLYNASVYRDEHGKVTGVFAAARDVTEHRKLEAQFIEAQKMEVIGQLAGGVAHDFNNILAVIMGNNDLILSELGPGSPLRECAEEIRHASERAAGLTQQLLIFSRKQTVQPVVLDLNDVVKGLDKMLRRLVGENIEMTIVPGKQTGRVKADSGHVGQVLMNLVVNARDAMPNGGKLTIAINHATLDENSAHTHPDAIPGDYVMLSVSDTGTGLTEEVKAHLFEAFFTTKPLGKGTGLGLATCRTIVQQSGGHIGVYSEAGQGTTFKVYFPRVDQPLDAAAQSIKAMPLPRGTETLLVVEDEPSVRYLVGRVLETQGYEVLSAANGQDVLRVAREHKGAPIHLVITDVIMPLMGGEAVAKCLKTTYPDLKILFMSGYAEDAIIQRGMLEAGVEFLPKPFTAATLAHKVREVLDQPCDSKPDPAQKTFGFTKIPDEAMTPGN